MSEGGREGERRERGGRGGGGTMGVHDTVSLSNVHTREVIMTVCVSILPGPIRVSVPSPLFSNLSLELAVSDLTSLKVKETSIKRRERERGREEGTYIVNIVYISKPSAKS